MKIGLLKETKTPPDKRVPLSPEQCKQIKDSTPFDLVVQKSDIRIFKDSEYQSKGLELVDDVSDCDILLGVKEVKVDKLIPNKTYFYFSHTIKEQPYNRGLLKKMLDLNITMIDWETLTSPKGPRLIGFGRYAGIVGAYNSFLTFGKKTKTYTLTPANQLNNRKELNQQLKKVVLPKTYKIIVSGEGRVARGAMEILTELGIKKVKETAFLTETFDEPVYTQIGVTDYFKRPNGESFSKFDFYKDSRGYESNFFRYAKVGDMFIAAHYWDSNSPFLFTRDEAKKEHFNIKVIADISCDIDGPVASTIRPSTIENPLYGYLASEEKEVDFDHPDAIAVMAVDNLPCELPRDASEDFGNEFINNVLPHLIEDKEKVIEKATICKNGELTSYYSYLSDYVNQ